MSIFKTQAQALLINLILDANPAIGAADVWKWIVGVVLGTATLIGAIFMIIKAARAIRDALTLQIQNIARDITQQELTTALEIQTHSMSSMKDSFFKSLETNFSGFRQDIRDLKKDIKEQTKAQNKLNETMQQGHLETWKRDIRDAYYTLRETGTIDDYRKSYIDKIYHIYKELGGNSDIDAKYKEISEVYATRTREQVESAFKSSRDRDRDKVKGSDKK